MRKFLAAIAIAMGSLPLSANCSSVLTLHVLMVGVYDNGNAYILLDQPIDEPGCSITSIEVPTTIAGYKQILATAQLAFATGYPVQLKTDTCFGNSPSFTGSRTAYFIATKQ